MREELPRVAIRPRDGGAGPRTLESPGAALGAKVDQDGGKAGSVRGDGRPYCPGPPVLVLPTHGGGGGVCADRAGAARVIRISEVAGERRRWRRLTLGSRRAHGARGERGGRGGRGGRKERGGRRGRGGWGGRGGWRGRRGRGGLRATLRGGDDHTGRRVRPSARGVRHTRLGRGEVVEGGRAAVGGSAVEHA